MSFKKYSKMVNHYDRKGVKYFTDKDVGILEEVFEITEKLHGANFSIFAYPDGNIEFASRNQMLEADSSFYGYNIVMSESIYEPMLELLKQISLDLNKDVRLIGELFGGRIQKGVFYGNEKMFRWFNLVIDNQYISPKATDELLKSVIDLKVPFIGYKKVEEYDFEKFVSDIDSEFQSKFTPNGYDQDNICEGVVIKPYNRVIFIGDSQLMVKKKNEAFLEKKSVKKSIKQQVGLEPVVSKWVDEILGYVNENRFASLTSKLGEFESIRDIGKFSKAFFDDVREDFFIDSKDEFVKELDKKQSKVVMKEVSKAIIDFLKKELV